MSKLGLCSRDISTSGHIYYHVSMANKVHLYVTTASSLCCVCASDCIRCVYKSVMAKISDKLSLKVHILANFYRVFVRLLPGFRCRIRKLPDLAKCCWIIRYIPNCELTISTEGTYHTVTRTVSKTTDNTNITATATTDKTSR